MAQLSKLYTTHLLVTNIHCPSCVSHVQDVLRPLPQIRHVDVSIIDHLVRVQHEYEETETITRALVDAAFEVQHVSTRDQDGRQIRDVPFRSNERNTKPKSTWPRSITKAQKRHIANCDACQSQLAKTSFRRRLQKAFRGSERQAKRRPDLSSLERGDGSKHASLSTSDSVRDPTQTGEFYIAEIAIGGMTCSSCVSAITKELKSKDFVTSVDISLLTNSGRVKFDGTQSNAQKLVESIDDIGYEASVISVSPIASNDEQTQVYKAHFSIEGMTCGSCVGTITRGLDDVPGLRSAHVDLVGASAVVDFQQPLNVEAIIERIEDLGYDASLIKIDEPANSSKSTGRGERNIQFDISGMYCPQCPQNIIKALKERFGNSIAILNGPDLRNPIISIQYIPTPPDVTARHLRAVIETVDPAIRASVYHPPSIEERSRRLQRRERNRILRHLVLTLLVAVPSFIIGIVYMNLVPENNSTRQWFEETIWSGTVMRMEWALFIMTTPAFFYGASIFHSRALLEIWSLWRPGSKIPLARRFYRFGSMNLLISAGTSVAYFSSLAILIMEATTTSKPSHNGANQRHSTTYFDTVTFLTLFILVGRFLEAYSKAKTGDAVAMLGNLRPVDALLLAPESENEPDFTNETSAQKVPVDLLEVGDRVSIPHGASPPVDGEIDQEGEFVFDESSLTGESKPVRKIRGDKVLTGSVNVSHPVRIKVQAIGSQSMLDQIINVVREGQAKRAPIERLADTMTGYFTPVITLLAISTWVIWLALGTSGVLPHYWLDVDNGGWPFWSVEFAIAVFVVACPCGIGLAAPTALFVGGGLAAKAGILVQGGGQAFQEASQIDAIVFDKTGTLTEGKMRVTDLQLVDEKTDTDDRSLILKLAQALEESSTHPIAQAITEFCQGNSQGNVQIQNGDVKETTGHGMIGTFKIRRHALADVMTVEAAIGNERLLEALESSRMKDDADAIESAQKLRTTVVEKNEFLSQSIGRIQSTGMSTAIFYMRQISKTVGVDNIWRPVALFAVTDPVRREAPLTLQKIRNRGIEVHMCTGDNPNTAQAIASQLQIPIAQVRAGVLPQDKATYINELQHDADGKRRIVAFVGDGTNDTPALSAADVPIALSSGSDVAVTAASFILLNSELTTILKLIKLARRVFLRVKLNFLWAGIYNICLIPVAAGVFFPISQWRLSPVWASLAMALSSVSVVLSSLALKLPEVDIRSIMEGDAE